MANTFKTLLNSDTANTRTLLHEAIPITGTIVSGTYANPTDGNIKTFAHGMFEAVYDYPYLSSSANHILDISAGYSADSTYSATYAASASQVKKINIYNQHAQVLYGYTTGGVIRNFDQDGDVSAGGTKMTECFFLNFSRLLTKDEIKKGSFRLDWYDDNDDQHGQSGAKTIGDYGAATSYKVNSPSGEYGLLYTSSAASALGTNNVVGHIYYQAGIAVLSANIVTSRLPNAAVGGAYNVDSGSNVQQAFTGSTITELANGFRFALDNIEFNNTTELNSTIYFCRANTQDYNYSGNPTYLTASKIRVKADNPKAEPVSYVTTVGLYSADNELLAVAKLSEPLKKSPSNELTLRVRLDY